MFSFAEDTGLINKAPKLKRVRNEHHPVNDSKSKVLYKTEEISLLLKYADLQLRTMIMLALNCGFGPKDIQDLKWDNIHEERATLPRSKTGISQTYLLWPETMSLINQIQQKRQKHIERMMKRKRFHSDNGHVFVTKFWKLWKKDSVAEQFRKLCKKVDVSCFGFYRLRHCASTAMSLVAMPHVHKKFMRHSQLQQQVTYTHTPDAEVDNAILKAKEKLLGNSDVISGLETGQGQGQVA
jgi:integrase